MREREIKSRAAERRESIIEEKGLQALRKGIVISRVA
jgi:hypothetical protein